MGTYQAAVYTTSELYGYCDEQFGDGYRAQQRAATHLDGAIQAAGFTPDVRTPNDLIPAPTEDTSTSFSTECPCFTADTCNYDYLHVWFGDYVVCNNLFEAEHSNVLLTNTSAVNGGRASADNSFPYCAAETGQHAADLPSTYDRYGYADAHNAMHTVLEEVGHNFIDTVDNNDGDGVYEHDAGAVFTHSNGNTISPMGIDNEEVSYDGGENNCETSFATDVQGWQLEWASCCIGDWRAAI